MHFDFPNPALLGEELNRASPNLFSIYFCLFVHKILVARRIQTRIIGVEGEVSDHQTTKSFFQPGIPYNLTTTDDSRLMGEHNQVSYLDVLFGDKSGGFFVEAGAFDGELFSNTLLLEKNRGWTGLLVSLQS